MNEADLGKMRKRIDAIDQEIIKMLNERMEIAARARKLKSAVEDPEMEKQVVANVRAHSRNLMAPDFSEKLFRDVVAESKRIQSRDSMLVGFQGEHGANSEIALSAYDSMLVPIPCAEFADVFEGVKKSQLDLGMVPVENSLEGAVGQVNDLLVEADLKVIGEITIPIHHNLLALPCSSDLEIRTVYSHPQALAQCRGFISRNRLEPRPFYDTAGAAKMLSEERMKGAAVIASPLCAGLYNLEIIKDNIEDDASNATRFVLLSREESGEKGNKCSTIFSTRHEAGALFRVLKIFADANINLTRIESRRVRDDSRKYAFLMDFQGSDKEAGVAGALAKLEKEASMYKFLGCYREWTNGRK